NCYKASARQETNPHLGRKSDHSRARIIKPAGLKGAHCDRPDWAFRWRQNPRFARQIGKLYSAPANPWALGTRSNDKRVLKEKFQPQPLVYNGTPCDKMIDAAFAEFTLQC